MRRIVLNTQKCTSQQQLHEILKRQLELPDYYGGNLDALWDCLTGWVDLPITVEWRGFAEAQHAIGEYVEKVLEILRKAEREVGGFTIEVV